MLSRLFNGMLVVVAVMLIFGVSLDACTRAFASSTASPEATPADIGCITVRSELDPAANPYPDCVLSVPWWSSWENCAVTPIHTEQPPYLTGGDQGLGNVPWIAADAVGTTVWGFQFFGSRPLHVDGRFPDGATTKTLWKFGDPVSGLTLTAHNLWDATSEPYPLTEFGVVNTSSSFGTTWMSRIDIPAAGCWRVDLEATLENGSEVTASVTYIVVE
jgi:hypothetical protein